MGLDKVWIVPLATFTFTISAFLISYPVAVIQGHVTLILSYISDAGSFAPESCFFGQLLNMAALFLAITVYFRHRQIVEFYWHRLKQEGRWRTMSCAILWIGYSSAFGVSMVANFQEHNVLYIHYFGAFLAFGCGLIYAWAQTVLTYQMCPKLAEPFVYHCRLALCILASILFFTTVVYGPILGAPPKNDFSNYSGSTYTKPYIWNSSEHNYYYHVIGTGSEWLLAICFQLYILSFAIELRHAYCHAPKLKLKAFRYEENRIVVALVKQTPVFQLFGLDSTMPERTFKKGEVYINKLIDINDLNSYVP